MMLDWPIETWYYIYSNSIQEINMGKDDDGENEDEEGYGDDFDDEKVEEEVPMIKQNLGKQKDINLQKVKKGEAPKRRVNQ